MDSKAKILLPATPQTRIPQLDGLRGLAILLVLLYHYTSIPGGHGSTQLAQQIFAIGWSGVDLFFILSGFLIGGILLDVRESPNYFKTFYARRFYRIVPLYYAWIGIFFALAIFWPAPENRLEIWPETWRALPLYALFLQNSVKIHHAVLGTAWLGALWSLAVEEQFYLVVPLVIRFVSGRKLSLLLWGAVICTPLFRVLLHQHVQGHPAAPYMLSLCRADALAMGVLLAMGWRSERCKAIFYRFQTAICGICVLLVGTYLYLAIWQPSQYSLAMYSWGYSVVDVLFATLLAIALMMPHGSWAKICRIRSLAGLGKVSFCLYVIHEAVNLACHQLVLRSVPQFNSWTTAFVTVVAAVLSYSLATLSWKFFEYPILQRGQARLNNALPKNKRVLPRFRPADGFIQST
ncbi:MAG TPA: acyltransferase [Candidatus Acidoferrales bacterium]